MPDVTFMLNCVEGLNNAKFSQPLSEGNRGFKFLHYGDVGWTSALVLTV
jgi:hypothetical protein